MQFTYLEYLTQWLFVYSELCIHHHKTNFRALSLCHKATSRLLTPNPSVLPSPRQPLISLPVDLPVLDIHLNGVLTNM